MKAPQQPASVAYSYIRFSSPEQAKGDSIRRQEALRDDWCKRNGVTLDVSLSLRDEGVSAFRGHHRERPDKHALAEFLELVRRGKVARGSYLVIESLDRLSREEVDEGLELLLGLTRAGIRVVQLQPTEIVYQKPVDPMKLVMGIMELSRGNSESAMKSKRVSQAWARKRLAAAGARRPLTANVPAWLEVRNGKIVLQKGKAAIVRRVYKMAIGGLGVRAIAKTLNAEGVKPISGKAPHWQDGYIIKLLMTRATVGECQPRRRTASGRQPDGPPIPGYFPRVVSEDDWYAVQAALKSRRNRGGRPPQRMVNLFAALLFDARDGGRLHLNGKTMPDGRNERMIAPYGAGKIGIGAEYVSFPYSVFEPAILSCLAEINPREILPQQPDGPDNKVMVLAGRRTKVEARIEKVKAAMASDADFEPLLDVLRKLDAELKTLDDQLGVLRQEAASPLSEAWGECRSLAEALAAAPDQAEARLRLQAVMRRVVNGVWCLFVPRGRAKLAAVQLCFEGGHHRDYLILYRPVYGLNSGLRPPKWFVRSLALPGKKGEWDLRDPADVADLERVLAAADLDALAGDEPAKGRGKEK